MNFELLKDKTRVIITGLEDCTKVSSLLRHVIQLSQKEIDFFSGTETELFDDDFVVIESTPADHNFLDYYPNIAIITGAEGDVKIWEDFLTTFTGGGILVYNSEDEKLTSMVENSENYIRKIPYNSPDFQTQNGKTLLETDLGMVPLSFISEDISYIEGCRHLCQHLGIQEEEFYEALISFSE